MAEHRIKVEEIRAKAPDLHAGDRVYLSGTVYTARDAAHKRLTALLDEGKELPLPLEGACIYYAGPCPAAPGEVTLKNFSVNRAPLADLGCPRRHAVQGQHH